MVESVFSTVLGYIRMSIEGTRSTLASALGALPYLLGSGEARKEVTEQYPDPVSSRTEDDLPPGTRGLLHNDIDRCTGCKDCETICPVKCIQVATEPGPESSKKWVSVFDIDFSHCIFCGFCVEVCPPGSLIHTRQFEGAVYAPEDLVTNFGRGAVSTELKEKWKRIRQTEEIFEWS